MWAAVGGHLRCTESRLAALGVYPDVPAALIARSMPHSRTRRRRPPVPRHEWAKALLGSWELSSEPTADAVAYGLADTVEIGLRPWASTACDG